MGKTTTASAIAVRFAARGERCLLVSTDPAHSLGDVFGVRIGDREQRLLPNLFGLEIDPDAQVDRYLAGVKRTMREFVRPEMYHEVDRQMSLNRSAPGAVEAATMERVAELMIDASGRYDRVVFDTAPTGHTLRLLELPEIMAAWTDGLLRHRERSESLSRALDRARGRSGDGLEAVVGSREDGAEGRSRRIREVLEARRSRFRQARSLLLDRERSALVLVLIPERLPVLETARALEALERFEVPVAGLVVNQVLPSGPIGAFLEERRDQQARHLDEIERRFRGYPRAEVALMPREVYAAEGLRKVAEMLEGGGR